MSRNLSAEAIVELFQESSDHEFLIFMEFDHSGFSTPQRIVSYDRDLSYNGFTWTGLPFKAPLPVDTKNNMPTIQMTIPNITQNLINELRALDAQQRPNAVMDIVRKKPDGTFVLEIGTLNFKVLQYQVRGANLQVTIGYEEDYINSPSVKKAFTPGVSPGVFQ